MPYFETDQLRTHYVVEGPDDAPWLILSNSLGTNFEMWAPQMPALRKRFRVLRYDTRGHGQSSVPTGPYSVEQLGQDVIALMDHLQIPRAHFCGLSMGGMIGMWLGIHQRERMDRLVLCNTAALIGPAEMWSARIEKVNKEGMGSIVPAVIERWFTPAYQKSAPEEVKLVRQMLLQSPTTGYTACCAAVRDMDQREGLFAIRSRTLVIAGKHDSATPAQDSKLVADRIAGARYLELDAAHLSNWEQADAFTDNLVEFLTQA